MQPKEEYVSNAYSENGLKIGNNANALNLCFEHWLHELHTAIVWQKEDYMQQILQQVGFLKKQANNNQNSLKVAGFDAQPETL